MKFSARVAFVQPFGHPKGLAAFGGGPREPTMKTILLVENCSTANFIFLVSSRGFLPQTPAQGCAEARTLEKPALLLQRAAPHSYSLLDQKNGIFLLIVKRNI